MKKVILTSLLLTASFGIMAGPLNNISGTDPTKSAVVLYVAPGIITSTSSAPVGVINRDRRTDASSAVLLGIVTDTTPIVSEDAMVVNTDIGHDVDHGLGDGLIINDPAYAVPPEKPETEDLTKSEIKPVE